MGRFQLPIAGEAGNIVLLGYAKPMRDCAVLASRAVPIAFAAPRGILKIRLFPHPLRGRKPLFSPLSVARCQSAFHSGMWDARGCYIGFSSKSLWRMRAPRVPECFWFLPSPPEYDAYGDSDEGDAGYPKECPSRATLQDGRSDRHDACGNPDEGGHCGVFAHFCHPHRSFGVQPSAFAKEQAVSRSG